MFLVWRGRLKQDIACSRAPIPTSRVSSAWASRVLGSQFISFAFLVLSCIYHRRSTNTHTSMHCTGRYPTYFASLYFIHDITIFQTTFSEFSVYLYLYHQIPSHSSVLIKTLYIERSNGECRRHHFIFVPEPVIFKRERRTNRMRVTPYVLKSDGALLPSSARRCYLTVSYISADEEHFKAQGTR